MKPPQHRLNVNTAVEVMSSLALLITVPAQGGPAAIGHRASLGRSQALSQLMPIRGNRPVSWNRGITPEPVGRSSWKVRNGPLYYFVPYLVYVGEESYASGVPSEATENTSMAVTPYVDVIPYIDVSRPAVDIIRAYVDNTPDYIDSPDIYGSRFEDQQTVRHRDLQTRLQEATPEPSKFDSSIDAQPVLPGQTDDDRARFWIVLKNHLMYAAVDYWFQGEMLHYITNQGDHYEISLSLVDWQASATITAARSGSLGRLP